MIIGRGGAGLILAAGLAASLPAQAQPSSDTHGWVTTAATIEGGPYNNGAVCMVTVYTHSPDHKTMVELSMAVLKKPDGQPFMGATVGVAPEGHPEKQVAPVAVALVDSSGEDNRADQLADARIVGGYNNTVFKWSNKSWPIIDTIGFTGTVTVRYQMKAGGPWVTAIGSDLAPAPPDRPSLSEDPYGNAAALSSCIDDMRLR